MLKNYSQEDADRYNNFFSLPRKNNVEITDTYVDNNKQTFAVILREEDNEYEFTGTFEQVAEDAWNVKITFSPIEEMNNVVEEAVHDKLLWG